MATVDDTVKAKVLRQVEFYFSDSNLPKDKFLKEQMDADGYVNLNVIVAFQRMRDMLKVPTNDPAAVPPATLATVADILDKSSTLQLDETRTKIKRKTPLADENEIARAVDARSIYARPFPMESTVDAITEFFSNYAPVNCVRMRRHMRSKGFKGSVFVEFASQEDAEKVLAMSLVFEGAPLRMQRKVEFTESKRAARKNRAAGRPANDGDISDDSNVGQGLPDGVGGVVDSTGQSAAKPEAAGGSHGQGHYHQQNKRGPKRKQELEYDEGDLGDMPSSKRSRPEKDGAKAEAAAEKQQVDVEANDGADEEIGEGEDGHDAEVAKPTFTPGCILGFNLEEELTLGPKVVVDVFGGRDVVKFVELPEERTCGYIRFHAPDLAAKALADYESRPEDSRTIAGIKGTMKKVEGEEEVNYYKRAAAAFGTRGDRGSRGGGFRGRGGRGGRFGGRGGFRGGRGGRGRGGRGRGGSGGRH
ncbi:hypothetical protein Vretimale_716 [Volvox reticuliferus]|uniref:Uncharacterized protein n=1 Tax=Volvox reticuliferus TaxID=1737510 RepID=A0A8J4D3Q2_9CHLO|nr:hypothetical protein Vretifemale_2126 [Volvox reticuliferus]GIL94740.1 hypothetical protein Vretimale_716 [Volvox reticuliferus]